MKKSAISYALVEPHTYISPLKNYYVQSNQFQISGM